MCMVVCIGACGLWRMSSGYSELKSSLERLPLTGPDRYPIADAKAMSINSQHPNHVMYHSYQQQVPNPPTRLNKRFDHTAIFDLFLFGNREQMYALLQYVQAQQNFNQQNGANISDYDSESVRKSAAAAASASAADYPESSPASTHQTFQ